MVAELLQEGPYRVAAWLLTYALHSTVFLTGAWLAAVVLARRACRSAERRATLPARREALWKFALVGGLVTATVQSAAGVDPLGGRIDLRASVVRADVTPETTVHASPAATTLALPRAAVRPTPTSSRPSAGGETGLTRVATTPNDRDVRPASIGTASIETLPIGAAPIATATIVTTPATTDSLATGPVPIEHLPARVVPDEVSAPSAWTQATWAQLVVLVWLAGVAFGLARWICQWNRLLRELDDRTPVRSGTVWEVYQHLRARAGLGREVPISMARGLRAPITLGVRRPEIVLPPRVETELQRDEIAALLAHELAHATRRDPAWVAFCRFVEVVFFFQPLNSRCASWLADEAEYLCDDWAVARVGERVALASCLTEIAGWIVHGPEPRLASGMAAAGTRLTLRVGRLLDEEHDPARAPRTRGLALVLAPAGLCVAAFVPRVSADVPGFEPDRVDRALVDGTREEVPHDEAPVDVASSPAAAPVISTATTVATTPARADARIDATRKAAAAAPRGVTPAPSVLLAPAREPATSSPRLVAVDPSATWEFLAVTPAASAPAPVDPAPAALDDVFDELEEALEALRESLAERGSRPAFEERLAALDQRLCALRTQAAGVQDRIDALTEADEESARAAASFLASIIPAISNGSTTK